MVSAPAHAVETATCAKGGGGIRAGGFMLGWMVSAPAHAVETTTCT